MRITKISVEKLFGIFNHEIPLNLDDRITIIHAPNGYGKTVMLTMLNGLFNSRYSELQTIPYENFQVEFNNGTRLEVRKKPESGKKKKSPDLSITLHSINKESPKSYTVKYSQKDLNPVSIEECVPGLIRISSREWLYKLTGEELSTEDVFERFSDQLSSSFRSNNGEDELSSSFRSNNGEDEWLTELKKEMNVYFIESQRLLSFSNELNTRYRKSTYIAPTVNAYSDELVQEIKERLAEYASVSESLDRSFPTRVFRQDVSNELTSDDLRNKLDELEQHRNRLVDSGLLEKDEGQSFLIRSQDIIDDGTKKVLAVYIGDVEKKLSVVGDLADKIDLFRRILNSKFSYKEIVVSRERGFIFRSKYPQGHVDDNISELLSPSSLSSGEQHELVLLYELLFKVKENSLVLIDEPELSLHVGWQVNFLRDLQEITNLANLDLLIATHSPSLINDRWDLTVELKGV
jgi:predicted ATP-binding protein involved in virulence